MRQTRQQRIEAELRGEVTGDGLLSHRALLTGQLEPLYQRHLCVVLEPTTGRYLGTAVAVLRREPPEAQL
jgi:hypothetical protein